MTNINDKKLAHRYLTALACEMTSLGRTHLTMEEAHAVINRVSDQLMKELDNETSASAAANQTHEVAVPADVSDSRNTGRRAAE